MNMFDISPFQSKITAALNHFEDELRKVRTGRAHPDMLSGVYVEVYGTKMPLNQVANITVPEAQLIQVNPFDPSNVQAIAAAIRADQSLGLNPTDDGRLVRVPIPPLTEERRRQIVKQLGDKAEEARIALRNIRQDVLKAAKSAKDNKDLSEDDLKRVEKDVDTFMSDAQSSIDALMKVKEKEVMTV